MPTKGSKKQSTIHVLNLVKEGLSTFDIAVNTRIPVNSVRSLCEYYKVKPQSLQTPFKKIFETIIDLESNGLCKKEICKLLNIKSKRYDWYMDEYNYKYRPNPINPITLLTGGAVPHFEEEEK